jgi:hypothetical protein
LEINKKVGDSPIQSVAHKYMDDPGFDKFLASLPPPKKKRQRPRVVAEGVQIAKERTELAPDAPAPHLDALIAAEGPEPTAEALKAWDARVNGAPIIDVAHQLGVSIELARHLINEVHAAIREDLKANLELNRNIDLHRIDQLILAYLPAAKAGDDKSATVVLKALQHRAKLTGSEPGPEPVKTNHVESVQAWIVNVLPSINRLVDDLPKE